MGEGAEVRVVRFADQYLANASHATALLWSHGTLPFKSERISLHAYESSRRSLLLEARDLVVVLTIVVVPLVHRWRVLDESRRPDRRRGRARCQVCDYKCTDRDTF